MPVDSGAFAERSDGGGSDGGQPVLCPTEGKTSPFSVRNVLHRREERAPSRGDVGDPENQAFCLLAVVARKGWK